MIRGFDYRQGIDVELSRAQWRDRLDGAAYTRRVGGDLLAYTRNPTGSASLAFEIYDNGVLGKPRRNGSSGQ